MTPRCWRRPGRLRRSTALPGTAASTSTISSSESGWLSWCGGESLRDTSVSGPRGCSWVERVFYLVIIVNAAVIFAAPDRRLGGAAVSAALIAAWFWQAAAGIKPDMPAPPLSVLDLSPIVEGASAADSFRNTLDLARHAERWGYRRFWLAEHHNMPGIAQLGNLGADRLRRRGHLDDPRGRRRRDAAQSLAAGDRRAVRHARIALPRTHRPGPGPRAGHRSRDDPRAFGATPTTAANSFPRRRSATAGATSAGRTRPARPRRSWRGIAGTGVAARVEPVQRTAGSGARAALCVCVALRARLPAGGARRLSARVPARPSHSSRPYAMATINVIAADSDAEAVATVHIGTAAVHPVAARNARKASAADRAS